jgi:hypothetical protein
MFKFYIYIACDTGIDIFEDVTIKISKKQFKNLN